MAQFDNDQVNEHCADPALNSMGAHEQAAAANERRRQQHLLLLSSSSSSSSTASSSAMSDGDRQSFVHAKRSQFERGHIPSAARFRQQANHLDRQRKHGSNRARQRAMNLQPNAFTALDDPLVAKEFVNKTVLTSQLHRQHSDGSSIGTQLMNVLKIDDDLSKSSSGALQSGTSNNMLMTHRQQQQQLQQQAKELDTCLNSSMPNIADGGLTDYNRHPQQGVAVDRQSVPLVLVSPADHGEAHHQQYLSQGSQPQIYAQSQHYEQYAIGDHLVPCPLNAPYHYHLHHDHLHLHHQPDTLIRPGLFQASDGHCDQILGDDAHLSYADLDEEINRHQRHHRQDATFKNLPESVVQANERVGVIESQQQQSYYPQQDRRHELQSYTDIDERGRRHVVDLNDRSNDDATTTLTALNSAVTNQPNRLDDTLKQSGSQTWRQSFTELTGTTAAQQPSCYLAESARIEPKHSFKSRNQPDSGNRSFNDARELENQQQQQQHGLAQADLDLDVTVQTNHSSNDIDEELKVCEWRDCGNTFLDMNEFVRHLEEKHVNLEPHEKNRYFCLWHNCKRNEQEFNARYKLLIHMRVHSGEKPYSCQKSANCKKSFSRLENLKIHVRSHTGEKPYSCKYENCSKSFTNSSDRIKHHKTHKDPKPYNCTQDGCTKRYTDPSSLRKHLRAHKRDSCGSMDLATPTACTSSFSSQMDHKSMLTQSATSHQLRHHDDDHHHQHHPENQAQYSYAGNQQPMIYSTTLNHQEQQQQQQQQQHLEPTYLNADYDPSREFANVLYGSSNASEISESMREAATDEASFYVDASFDRPHQQRENLHLTNLDEYNGRPQRAQQSQQPRRVQYEMSDRQHQRPSASRMRNQMELRHQQLARSWCGGSISEANMYPVANQRSREMISDPHQSSHQQHRTVLYPPSEGPQTRQSRELRFTQAPRDGQLDSSDISTNRGQQVSSARFQNSFRAANPQDQQAQHVQDWRAQEANVSHLPPDNNQRQIHYQQHQNQLTRRQQHEQLMRSMPANVAYYQS